jgi:hypothetical protein
VFSLFLCVLNLMCGHCLDVENIDTFFDSSVNKHWKYFSPKMFLKFM